MAKKQGYLCTVCKATAHGKVLSVHCLFLVALLIIFILSSCFPFSSLYSPLFFVIHPHLFPLFPHLFQCRASSGPCPGLDFHKGKNAKDNKAPPRTSYLTLFFSFSLIPLQKCSLNLIVLRLRPLQHPVLSTFCASLSVSFTLSHLRTNIVVPPATTMAAKSQPAPVSASQTADTSSGSEGDGEVHQALALFDFPPENARELALKKGDIIEILKVDSEWWFGVLPDGSEGNLSFPLTLLFVPFFSPLLQVISPETTSLRSEIGERVVSGNGSEDEGEAACIF